MAMGKLPGNEDELGDGVFAEINITPLTDIFLVLLIIFMVTSTVIVRRANGTTRAGLKVQLPKAGAADSLHASKDLAVAILADGRLVLSGTVVSKDELSKALRAADQKSPDTVVIIQADEGVPHGKVVDVMELARAAGLSQLAIGVRKTQK